MQLKPTPIDIEASMAAVNAAMEFVSYAHRKGHSYTGTVYFSISDPETNTNLQKSIKVSPSKVEIIEGKDATTNCTVTINKDVLFSILAGAVDPMVAFMCGQVIIDNPIALVQFAQAFELTPQKLEEFKLFLESRSREPEIQSTSTASTETPSTSITTVQISPPTMTSPVNSDNTYRPLTSVLASTMLTALYKAHTDIDRSVQQLKADPRYQAVTAKVNEFSEQMNQSPSMQAVQSNPAVKYLVEVLQKEYRAQKIEETMNDYMQLAQICAGQVLGYLTKQAQQPGVDRNVKKAQLEAQLEALREQNRKNDEERKLRVKTTLQQ